MRGAAAGAGNGDEIQFSPSLGQSIVIELQSTLVLDSNIDLTVQGPGSDRLVIRPAGLFRPIAIDAVADGALVRVVLSDLTIRDGVVLGASGANGGTPGRAVPAGPTRWAAASW